MNLNKIAQTLDTAAFNVQATTQVSANTQISLDDSYAVQSISMGLRYLRGEKRTGIKLGFTSKAKMQQMGVHDLIWGRLTNHMYIPDRTTSSFKRYIHPRAEPEIAFLLNQDIKGPITLDTATDIVKGIAIAIEIIDSRYQNFEFNLTDVIADNCSSSGYCHGIWHQPDKVDIANIPIQLSIDGQIVQTGFTSHILGNPWQSVVDAVRLSIKYGEPLYKGDIIFAGAATPAVHLKSGQTVEAYAPQLGLTTLFLN